MSLRQAHRIHVQQTAKALSMEIGKPLLPIHAKIALSNAAIAVKEAERNVTGLWTSPSAHFAVEFIRKARKLLDEAEAAIHGVVAQ